MLLYLSRKAMKQRKKHLPRKRLKPNLKWSLKRKKRMFRRTKSKRKKSPVTWGTVSRKWHRVSRWGTGANGTSHSGGTSDRKRGTASRSDHLPDEQTMFHSLVEQINGGRSRVAELLQKHEIPVPATVPAAGNDESRLALT